MVGTEPGIKRSLAIRKEVVATYSRLVNDGSAAIGLLDASNRRESRTRYNGSDLEMHFTLLPHERQFKMDAATFRRRHDSGDIFNYPLPSESEMVSFLGLCYVATEHYNRLLNRRPYQTQVRISA